MGLEDIKEQASKSVGLLKDPFKSEKITGVSIRAFKSTVSDKWVNYGRVEFKNGETKGEQEIRGDSLNDVIKKVSDFIKELEK